MIQETILDQWYTLDKDPAKLLSSVLRGRAGEGGDNEK